MNRTRLFIQKEPKITNNFFIPTANIDELSSPRKWRLDGWDDFEPQIINGKYQYSPATLKPWDGNAYTAAVQDINTKSGVYTIAVEIEQIDTTIPYDGNYCIGIGSAYRYLGPNGTTSPSSSVLTEPGLYVFKLSVSIANLSDPVFGNKLNITASGGQWLLSHPLTNLGIKSIFIKGFTTDEWDEVDLYDDIQIPITYNVADVRDISKKNSNWSLDIDIPNTPNNAQLFDCIHEIESYSSTFEMLNQYKCFVEVDNNRTFDGYLKLNEVIINDKKEISYKCNLYSEIIELFKKLGNTTMRDNENPLDDIDLGLPEVSLTQTVVKDRLVNSHSDWGFTLIDKNNKTIENYVPLGSVGSGKKSSAWFFDELTPWVSTKLIFEKILEWAGDYTLVSDFMTNPSNQTGFDFTKIVSPFVNGNSSLLSEDSYMHLSQENYDTNGGLSFNWTPTTVVPPYTQSWLDEPAFNSNYTIEEVNSNTSLTPFVYNCQIAGNYNINIYMPLLLRYHFTGNYYQPYDTPGDNVYVLNTYSGSEIGYRINCSIRRYNTLNNTYSQLAYFETGTQKTQYDARYTIEGDGYATISNNPLVVEWEGTAYLEQGDRIYILIGIQADMGSSYGGYDMLAFNKTNSFYTQDVLYPDTVKCVVPGFVNGSMICNIDATSTFGVGNTFNPNFSLNPKTKKVDWLTNIIRKFNLYIEDVSNKKIPNTNPPQFYPEKALRIEPRNQYYSLNETVKDWTNRVVFDTIKHKRIDDYIYDVISLNDKNDETYFVADYNLHKYKEGEYGQKIIFSPYNISSDEKTEITTGLGQTMIVKINSEETSLIQAPAIFSLSENLDLQEDKEYNERLFFVDNVDIATAGNIMANYRNEFIGVYHRSLFATDPYNPSFYTTKFNLVSNFNHPYGDDTADLNFNYAKWYYVMLNNKQATLNNCYRAFYEKMIDEYNDANARLMTCRMYLKPSDIRDLQLSDTIIIDEVAYHINKIKEWKNGEEAVEIELIKIIESNSNYDIQPTKKGKQVVKVVQQPMTTLSIDSIKTEFNSINEQMMEVNKSIESGNVSITELKKMIADIDYRLKKLES